VHRVVHASDFPVGLDSDIRSRRHGVVVDDRVDENEVLRPYKIEFKTSPGGARPRGVELPAL
jgi:hypothetical protein